MLIDPSFPKGFLGLWVKTNETGLPGQWQREGNSPRAFSGDVKQRSGGGPRAGRRRIPESERHPGLGPPFPFVTQEEVP